MTTKNIVFVDARVSHYASLIDGLADTDEVFVLDGESDGLGQMADWLVGRSGVDAIHVISHGSQGALVLGSTVLDSGNLAAHGLQLADIGAALTAGGDILLYGCNVAAGAEGAAFVAALAQATGADVAASDDATGAAALGGDWMLEEITGDVKTSNLQSARLIGLLGANTAPTFTLGDGLVKTDFGQVSANGLNVTVQADAKIIMSGAVSNGNHDDFAFARYNTDGSLDNTFSDDGKLTTNFEGNGPDTITSMTVQTDGKILIAGQSQDYVANVNAYQFNFALTRYNADGSLDVSFSDDGQVKTDFGFHAFCNSIAVKADGKILVAGTSNGDFALARYNDNGTLDASFSGDGKLTTDFGGDDYGNSLTLQTDGKILVAGTSNGDFALARYNDNGTLDASFSGDGKLTTDFGGDDYGNSLTLQTDGKILVVGNTEINHFRDIAVARYTSDGSLDNTFSDDGRLTTDFAITLKDTGSPIEDTGNSVTVQTDGKILVAGMTHSFYIQPGFALVRYNNDGSLDTSFSPPENTLDNKATFKEPSYQWEYGNSQVALDPDVQILDTELAATGNYNGATLTLQRHGTASPQDVFSAASSALTTLTTGSYFAIDSVTIGRVTSNSAGTLILSFNASATQSLVNKAMQQIAYANSSDAPPASLQIDWTFNDGNTGAQSTGGAMSVTGSTTVQITATNDAPVLNHSLVDQSLSANTPFSYTFPADAFTDPDLETLSYRIRMNDGTGVPPWLTFSPTTRSFSGTPGVADAGELDIVVSATDSANAAASYTLRLSVSATPAADTTAPTVITFSPADEATGVAVGSTSCSPSAKSFSMAPATSSSRPPPGQQWPPMMLPPTPT